MTGSTATAIAANERRAEQYFGAATLKKIESVAGRQLEDCGYNTFYVAGDEDPPKALLRWWEFTDDIRRMMQALRTSAGMSNSKRLSYISRRVRGALRQKRSLK